MKHECKFEEVIPRVEVQITNIEKKLDKALEFKYLLTGGALAVAFIVGVAWKVIEFIYKGV
jgi:hypothetical protein